MAEQRQPFRFRLPWQSAATTTPRPTAQPQPPRPPVVNQAPTQPTTTVPVQRPPFRPAGIAPVQPPPPPAPAPPRTEPQPPSPPRATNESRVDSQPASPSRATTQTQASSVPPSPSRGATKSQVTSQPASPSRATTQTQATSQTQSPSRAATQSRAASVPPSPSHTASQPQTETQTAPPPQSPSRLAPKVQTSSQPSSPLRTSSQVQPTAGVVSQPASPPKKLQPTTQETSLPPSSTQPPPPTSQQPEPKPALSLQLSQELQPKTETISETVSKSQNQAPTENTFQPGGVAAQSTQASGLVTEVAPPTSKATLETPDAPQKSDSKSIGADHPTLLSESEKRLQEIERKKDVEELMKEEKTEGKKVEEELKKDGKTKGLAYEEPTQRTITKQTLTTSSSKEKQIKTVRATHPKERNTLQQKPVISNGERAPLHKEIREDISKLVHTLATGNPKQPMDERSVGIITLTGENRGATMHLGSESEKKDGSVHIYRGYKLNPDESPEATSDGEERSKGRKSAKPITKEDPAPWAYINNNTQSINNSILFNSSVNERNPGVHLIFSHESAEPTKSSTKPEPFETHKAEFNVTPSEKLTYEPTVRRRCLRGLFMEPSDSDPDDPKKPRRHGCYYNCGEKSKDKEIGSSEQ